MDAHDWIRKNFPNLRGGGYEIISSDTSDYNCIAWAADEVNHWWWPSQPMWPAARKTYWPQGLPYVETLENFIQAFKTLGYEVCDTSEVEHGYEKVAIYVGSDGRPKHMAKQLLSGKWTSKLGDGWDIAHDTLEGVECNDYEKAIQFLKRPIVWNR